MHSHLDIKVNGKSLVIPDDSSLSVEEKNPMFNDVTFFSYPMKIPVEGNREVLKNIAHRDSDMRAMDLEHADARIFGDGLPLNHGQVITQDGSEIKDTFEFNIDAQQQSFSELIGDLECQDVKVKDRLVIGEKIGDIRFTGRIYLEERRTIYEENWVITDDPTYVGDVALNTLNKRKDFIIDSPQALGFSIPAKAKGFPEAEYDSNGKLKLIESYINVSQPYGSIVNSPYTDESGATLGWPFCNARVAYAHPDVKENDDGTKETEGTVKGNAKGAEKEDYGQYWCLDADRPQSGICFYVLYFLDCLFHQLGVVFNKDELMEVEDLKRLCFFTTVCHFDEDDTENELRNDEIQQWLDSRNCGGKVGFGINTGKTKKREDDAKSLPHVDFFKFEPMDYRELEEKYTFPIGEPFESREMFDYYDFYNYLPDAPVPRLLHVQYYRNMEGYFDVSTTIHEMVANSENFPKDSVSNVISSLEASFGIRFLYDPEKRTVTARLLRNIYKTKGVRQFEGQVLSMTPKNEKITGVRVLYSAESDKKEQRNNVRYGVKDYDTEFDYIEFPQDRTITDLTYNDIIGQVNSTNRRVYIDQTTGDVYRIKIDSEAKDMFSLHPVLFRVAQYKGIEIGDCSEKNEDYVKEFSSGFQPLTVSIINAMDYNDDRTGEVSPIFAPLLEVDMEHEYLPMYIESATDVDTDELRGSCAFPNHVGLALREELSFAESYDPTQTDDGNSPLQEIDWGLTVAIMRGGGAGSEIVEFDRGYDGFDNSRWKDVVGIYAMYSDSLDPKGAMFGYSGEQFSLSVRAWVQPEWSDAPMCADDERDQQGHIVHRIRSRGTADAFMAEHIHALLNRKPFKVEVQATVAQLLDIRNHWEDKYVLDGKVGFINAVKYNIERATGVGESELEFYAL